MNLLSAVLLHKTASCRIVVIYVDPQQKKYYIETKHVHSALLNR